MHGLDSSGAAHTIIGGGGEYSYICVHRVNNAEHEDMNIRPPPIIELVAPLLDSYGLRNILQTHPNVCKALFVQDDHDESAVDTNYLFSIMNPKFSEASSTRK